jgi:hypothetical protein
VEKMDKTDASTETIDPKDVALKMRLDYLHGVKDPSAKALDAIVGLCSKIEELRLSNEDLTKETADLIVKHFSIRSVAIASKDHHDGLLRYKVVLGVDQETVEGFKKLTYTEKQALDPGNYPGHEISSHTRLYLGEDHPYADGEEFTYRVPSLIGVETRKSLTDSIEADYVDFFMFGPDRDLLGWIEVSGTRMRKLPDATTLRWIELIAYILGFALRPTK